jgi:hypothetical protein
MFGDLVALAANSPKIRGEFVDDFNQNGRLRVTRAAPLQPGCAGRATMAPRHSEQATGLRGVHHTPMPSTRHSPCGRIPLTAPAFPPRIGCSDDAIAIPLAFD